MIILYNIEGVYDIMNISFRKKTLVVIVICLMMLMSLPVVLGATHNENGPVLEVEFLTGPHFPAPTFRVENIGDETAHNIKLTDITVNGSILYNNREMKIADGFVYSENAYRYLVRGKVKNNGTKNIFKAWVTVNFYDKENNSIYSPSDVIFHFETNDIRDFAVDFTKYDDEGFPNADHIGFTFMKE
jgi:hypothetical protein